MKAYRPNRMMKHSTSRENLRASISEYWTYSTMKSADEETKMMMNTTIKRKKIIYAALTTKRKIKCTVVTYFIKGEWRAC